MRIIIIIIIVKSQQSLASSSSSYFSRVRSFSLSPRCFWFFRFVSFLSAYASVRNFQLLYQWIYFHINLSSNNNSSSGCGGGGRSNSNSTNGNNIFVSIYAYVCTFSKPCLQFTVCFAVFTPAYFISRIAFVYCITWNVMW